MKPTYNLIAIRRIDKSGAIEIVRTSESVKPIQYDGVVVAIGPGDVRADGSFNPVPCKVGDRVIYSVANCQEITVGRKKLDFVRAVNVFCVVGPEDIDE